MKQEDQGQCSSYSCSHQSINNYQDQILLQQQQQQQIMMQQHHQQQQQTNTSDVAFGVGGGFNMFPSDHVSPWSSIPQYHPFNVHHQLHDPFLVPPQQQQQQQPPPPPSPYASFFNRSSALFNISEALVHQAAAGAPFGLQAEIGKMTAQEIMEAKALAASKSHSEAERRRRERINNHLAKLRSLLPSTTKTDKASLLAEVIQHVKELKRQTSLIEETSPVPTEADELTVDAADEDGRFVIKASLCCEDRSDLLPELIKTLKALKLRTLKADITTLGGRVKNVLFITAEEEYSSSNNSDDQEHGHGHYQYCISSIQEALRAVMDKCVNGNTTDSASASVKRQRTNIISIS